MTLTEPKIRVEIAEKTAVTTVIDFRERKAISMLSPERNTTRHQEKSERRIHNLMNVNIG